MKNKKLITVLLSCAFALCISLAISFAMPISARADDEPVTSGTCGTSATWSYNVDTNTLTISGTGPINDYIYSKPPYYTHYKESTVHVVVNEGITSIGAYAFADFDAIESVVIPNSVTYISNWGLAGNTKLTSVTIGTGLREAAMGAFYGCSSLESITLPNSFKSAGQQIFKNCTNLKYVGIENTSLEDWGAYIFYNCPALESIILPNTLTSIPKNTFDSNSGIKTIYSRKSVEDIAKITINDTIATNIGITHLHSYLTDCNTTCINCDYERVAPHMYSSACDTTCNNCDNTREPLANHEFTNACDTTCDMCGEIRTITHDYKTEWSTDGTNHWHECSVCGDKKDLAGHISSGTATEYVAEDCTICGYIINPALGHTCHDGVLQNGKDATCTEDGFNSYYKCSGCEKVYKEAECTNEITDLSAWKLGEGKITALCR